MKRYLIMAASVLAIASCGQSEDEVPPRSEGNSSMKVYMMPEPVELTQEESAEVAAISAEFTKNTPK